MQRSPLYFTIGLLLTIIVAANSCTKKVNGIDNDQVIETPYSLFFADTAGGVYNSTDGKTIQRTVFKADGFPCRALCVIDNNLFFIKNHLYISSNNGKNFNHAYDSVTTQPFKPCVGAWQDLNQSMIINIPDWHTAFLTIDYPTISENYVGVGYSLNVGGVLGSWWADLPDTPLYAGAPVEVGNFGPLPFTIRMTSFSLLKNGTLCGYDARNNRCFYRTKTTLWKELTANPDSVNLPGIGDPANRSGDPLPNHQGFTGSVNPIDTSSRYSYGHYNNRLIAIDQLNCNSNGALYSDDNGRNWKKYTGLPNKALLCINSPFEEICLIGTDSAGLYVLNNNTGAWQQQTNNGLGKNLVVRSIAYKENVYKNGKLQKFVYLATNLGIYQSVDGGNNWVMTIPGNYTAVY